MKPIIINKTKFLRGANETDYSDEGGYSPEDKGHNLYVKKGLLYPQPTETENAGTVEDIIGWGNVEGALGADLKAMGKNSSSDGKFYSLTTEGVATLQQSDTGRNYSHQKSDFIFYKNKFYASSTIDIARLDNDLANPDWDWWTATMSGAALQSVVPHKFVIFDNILYFSDENVLKSYNGSAINEAAFTIDEYYYITAVIRYKNKIYVAAEPYWNASGTYHIKTKIFVWNGVDTTYEACYEVPDRIDEFYDFNGVLMVFTARYVGYWNGIRVIPLRDLSDQVFKYMIVQYRDRLYFVQTDTKNILCFDGKRWSYFYVGANVIKAIYCGQSEKMIFSSNSKTFKIDLSTGAGTSYWRDESYDFPQNVIVDKAIVQLGEVLVSGSEIVLSFYDHKGTEQTIGSLKYADGDRWAKEFKNINITTLACQPRVHFKTNAKPIKQISIYPIPSERQIR